MVTWRFDHGEMCLWGNCLRQEPMYRTYRAFPTSYDIKFVPLWSTSIAGNTALSKDYILQKRRAAVFFEALLTHWLCSWDVRKPRVQPFIEAHFWPEASIDYFGRNGISPLAQPLFNAVNTEALLTPEELIERQQHIRERKNVAGERP